MVSDDPINTSPLTDDEIQLVKNQLEAILESKYFKSAKQLQRFLSYIVEKTIAGEEAGLKQYTIAIEALSFAEDFDPDENPAVRIMGGRVRRRLDEYYDDDRNKDELIIIIPKGSYVPEFKKKTNINKNTHFIKESDENQQVSRGPTLALVSYTDKTQSEITNQLLVQLTDSLATDLSCFLYLQLLVCNPVGDKDQSHLPSSEFKSLDSADYALILYLQKIDNEVDKYKFIYRLTLVQTDEILWSENYLVTKKLIEQPDIVISKITATVTDHLQGIMHTHWSRGLLTSASSIPDHYKVLVLFRNYTDYFDRPTFKKGVNACLEALSRNPNDVIANLIYAGYCRREYSFGYGVIKSPIKEFKRCIEITIRLSPNSHEARYVHGLLFFYQKDWEHCTEEFELARGISKNNVVMEFGIGYTFWKMGLWDKGLSLVKKAMLLSTTYPSYYHVVPFFDYYRQEKYEQALYEAEKITTVGFVHGPLARCVAYSKLGELKKAEKEMHELLSRCPRFIQTGRKFLTHSIGAQTLVDKVWGEVLIVSDNLR